MPRDTQLSDEVRAARAGQQRECLLRDLHAAQEALALLLKDAGFVDALERAADVLTRSLRNGGKVLACGNGGSMADALHFCEELTGRYRADRPPIAAVACGDAGHLTCVANDYGFEEVFARWVRGLARPGDVVVLLSTSGSSRNVVRAADAARGADARVITLLGRGGGLLAGRGDVELLVPGETSDRIQELHMLCLHALVGAVERGLGYAAGESGA